MAVVEATDPGPEAGQRVVPSIVVNVPHAHCKVSLVGPVFLRQGGGGEARRQFVQATSHGQRGFSGTIVSPRASIATSAAIFLARPAGVFMLLVRNASAKRFCRPSVRKVLRARGLASMAARRSVGDGRRRSRCGSGRRPHPSGRRPWRRRPAAGRAASCGRRRSAGRRGRD